MPRGNKREALSFPQDYSYVKIKLHSLHGNGTNIEKLAIYLHLSDRASASMKAMFHDLVSKYNAIAERRLVIRARNNLIYNLQHSQNLPNELLGTEDFFNDVLVPDIRRHGFQLIAGHIWSFSGPKVCYKTPPLNCNRTS
eukprot:3763147-Prymnesium_polylepis.1